MLTGGPPLPLAPPSSHIRRQTLRIVVLASLVTRILDERGAPAAISPRNTTQALLFTMGSFPANWRCPLCGRVGNGGYVIDGFPRATCTDGDYSCLWFQVSDRGLTAGQIYSNALEAVLQQHTLNTPELRRTLIAFLFGDAEVLFEDGVVWTSRSPSPTDPTEP